MVERITRKTFSEGRKKAEEEFLPKLEEMQSALEGFKNSSLADTKSTEEPETQTKADRDHREDKAFQALAKRYESLEKQNLEFRSELKSLSENLHQERRDLKKRENETRALSMIAEAGFEEPETILTVLRSKVGLGTGVNEDSGMEDLVVLKPGTTEPYKGEGHYTTFEEFLEEWKETKTAKRFQKVSGKAKEASDITGDNKGRRDFVGTGVRGLSDDVLMRSLHDKSRTPLG